MEDMVILIDTPALRTWMAECQLTLEGCSAVMNFARDCLQDMRDEAVPPGVALHALVATLSAFFEATSMPRSERVDAMVYYFRLLMPVVMAHDFPLHVAPAIRVEPEYPLVETPALIEWLRATGMTPSAARKAVGFARDQVQWAAGSEPRIAYQSIVAGICAVFGDCAFPAHDRLSFLIDSYPAAEKVVGPLVIGWNPAAIAAAQGLDVH